MANSANPEINKKIATSALGTLVIATVFFYLGDRNAETLVTYPGQIIDHLSDAFLSILLIGHGIFLVRKLAVVYNSYRPQKKWNKQRKMDDYELRRYFRV